MEASEEQSYIDDKSHINHNHVKPARMTSMLYANNEQQDAQNASFQSYHQPQQSSNIINSNNTYNYYNVIQPNYIPPPIYPFQYGTTNAQAHSANYSQTMVPFPSMIPPSIIDRPRLQPTYYTHAEPHPRYNLQGWDRGEVYNSTTPDARTTHQPLFSNPSSHHMNVESGGPHIINARNEQTFPIINNHHQQSYAINPSNNNYQQAPDLLSNMAQAPLRTVDLRNNFMYGDPPVAVQSADDVEPPVPRTSSGRSSIMTMDSAIIPTHYTSEFQTYAPPPPTKSPAIRTSSKRAKATGSIADGRRPQRRGPLSASTRNKVEEIRDMSACWRCRKYKKPCNGPGICDSCLIPKFKIWPSAIGCRRENLESMVLFLLPVQLEEGLGKLSECNFKASPRSWRQYRPARLNTIGDEGLQEDDIWTVAKKDLLATNYFGNDFIELADIAIRYQKSLPVPHKCLQAACQTLIATCNWYKCVVNVPNSPPPIAILQAGTSVRTNTRKAFTLLQHTCLSTKRTDWFPAVLSALLLTIGAVYYMDVILHLPPSVRTFIWHDLASTRTDLRNKTYMLLVDLLRASTKGINPLNLDCWANPVCGKPEGQDKVKEREREVLLGDDKAAMEGLAQLKSWKGRYDRVLEMGKRMFEGDMVQQSGVPPIAGSWKVFEMDV